MASREYRAKKLCKEYLDNDEIYSSDDIILEGYVVYYHDVALEFLKTHDPSLRESLDIANELGFSLDKLSSEVLATLLLQTLLEEGLNLLRGENDNKSV